MKLLSNLLFAAGLLLAANQAHAVLDSIPCNGCTDSGMQSAAKISQKRIGSGYVAVFNFTENSAKKFYRSLRFNDYGEPVRAAYEVNFTGDEQHDVDLILQFRQDFQQSMLDKQLDMYQKEATNTPYIGTTVYSTSSTTYKYAGSIDVKGNPYDFLSRSAFRNNTFDYYMQGDSAKFSELLDSALDAVRVPTGSEMELYIDINFYDGPDKSINNGTVKASPDFINDVFTIMSAKDADNNSIPLDKYKAANGELGFKNKINAEEVYLNYINLLWSSSGSNVTCVVTNSRVVGDTVYYTYRCG